MTKIISAQQGVSLFLLNGRFADSTFALDEGVTCFCLGHPRQGNIDENGFSRVVFIPDGRAREVFSVAFPAKRGDEDFVVRRYRSDGIEQISGRFMQNCLVGSVRFIVAPDGAKQISLSGLRSHWAGFWFGREGAPRGCDADPRSPCCNVNR
jgi:hypothetical protein